MRVCNKCGKEVDPQRCTCHNCGAKIETTDEINVYPMKWYNFLIKFWLFASGVSSLAIALIGFFGKFEFDIDVTQLFRLRLAGLILLVAAAFFFFARYTLINEKRVGPKALICAKAVFAIWEIVDVAIIRNLLPENIRYVAWICIAAIVVVSAVDILLHIIYFRKRRDIFIGYMV